MAIFDRFFKRQKPTQTKSANMVGYFGVGTGNSKNYQYDELAREGYLKNAIVYRCVNEISKGAGAVQYMIKSNDETLDSHPNAEDGGWCGCHAQQVTLKHLK